MRYGYCARVPNCGSTKVRQSSFSGAEAACSYIIAKSGTATQPRRRVVLKLSTSAFVPLFAQRIETHHYCARALAHGGAPLVFRRTGRSPCGVPLLFAQEPGTDVRLR